MAQESCKRKLTAILSADVEGYSRLMGEDAGWDRVAEIHAYHRKNAGYRFTQFISHRLSR